MTDELNVEIEDVELSEDENLEEGTHDPENAEEQSITATAKADDGVKKAPARTGDKKNQDKMKKLDKKGVAEETDTDDEELEENVYDFSDDLSALVESEATLSDEFKAKSAIIFEAAISSKISEEVERLEDEYQTKLAEELQATREDLVEKVDNYLNYVVETWMEENELAIESGLRTEIAEDFMGSLKELFVESYIDVPESKVDLVDELANQVEELEEDLNKKTDEILSTKAELETYQREAIIRENSDSLAETEVEKLSSLVESLEFEDAESFSNKVKTVKESYFRKESTSDDVEEINEDWTEEREVSSSMDRYVSALSRIKQK